MPVCAVKTCKNRSQSSNLSKDGITFHRFPKIPSKKHKWVEAIGNPDFWTPTRTSTICSKHFELHCFDTSKKSRRRLLKSAIPTLFLPNSSSNPNGETSAATDRRINLQIKKLNTLIMNYKKIIESQQKIIKKLKQTKNTKRNATSIKEVLSELRNKCYIECEVEMLLSDIGLESDDLFKREIVTTEEGEYLKTSYSPELRAFALTLNYYSPTGYDYAYKTFNTSLPSPKLLNKWSITTKGSPGFHKEAFQVITRKAQDTDETILCSLIVEPMALTKCVEYHGKYYGFVDAGFNLDCDNLNGAHSAMVFLIVALNGSWKISVAYFLIDTLNSEQKAALINRCLELVFETGVSVVSLTLDFPQDMLTAERLGTSFDLQNFKTTFKHPSNQKEVAIFFDPCSMIKWIRIYFMQYRLFKDSSNQIINWQHVENLTKLQITNDVRKNKDFCDKITKLKLSNFSNENVFNRSVPDAIEYFDEVSNHEEFKTRKEGTVKFLKTINDLFDILNSHPHQSGLKKALDLTNKDAVFEYLSIAKHYLTNLTVTVTQGRKRKDIKIVESNNKTGFTGLCVNIDSLIFLYNNINEEVNSLKAIPAHKFAQNELRYLFSYICSETNRNEPTPRTFQQIYKGITSKSKEKHENIAILNWSSDIDHINATTHKYHCQYDGDYIKPVKMEKIDFTQWNISSVFLSEHRDKMTKYAADVVARDLAKTLRCETCLSALIDNEKFAKSLTSLESKPTIYASSDVTTICKLSDRVLKESALRTNFEYLPDSKVLMQEIMLILPTHLFKDIEFHQFDNTPLCNHTILLTRAVVNIYLNSQLKMLATFIRPKVNPKKFCMSFLGLNFKKE